MPGEVAELLAPAEVAEMTNNQCKTKVARVIKDNNKTSNVYGPRDWCL